MNLLQNRSVMHRAAAGRDYGRTLRTSLPSPLLLLLLHERPLARLHAQHRTPLYITLSNAVLHTRCVPYNRSYGAPANECSGVMFKNGRARADVAVRFSPRATRRPGRGCCGTLGLPSRPECY